MVGAADAKTIKATDADLLPAVRELGSYEFEHLVADVWAADGWSVEVSEQQGDGGIDVRADNGEQTVAIQAKRYGPNTTVGAPEVRTYAGLIPRASVDRVVIVTTGTFTKPAREEASKAGIELVDGPEFIGHLKDHEQVVDEWFGPDESDPAVSTTPAWHQLGRGVMMLAKVVVALVRIGIAAGFAIIRATRAGLDWIGTQGQALGAWIMAKTDLSPGDEWWLVALGMTLPLQYWVLVMPWSLKARYAFVGGWLVAIPLVLFHQATVDRKFTRVETALLLVVTPLFTPYYLGRRFITDATADNEPPEAGARTDG